MSLGTKESPLYVAALPEPTLAPERAAVHNVYLESACFQPSQGWITSSVVIKNGLYLVAVFSDCSVRLFDLTNQGRPLTDGICIGKLDRHSAKRTNVKLVLVEEEDPNGCCFVFAGTFFRSLFTIHF